MPNYNQSTRQRIADIGLGLRVDRAAATHSGAATAYFTVVGEVLMTGLVGKVTTASGANASGWSHVPTAGTTQPICANLDIDPALVGDLLTITGVATDAMTYNGTAGGNVCGSAPVVLSAGSLKLTTAAADGATSWSIFYVPLSDGAYVAAA